MATPRVTTPRLSSHAHHFTSEDPEGLAALQDADNLRRLDGCRPGETPDACELWEGPLGQSGHGRFRLRMSPSYYRDEVAERIVWARVHGPIPAGYVVRHRCPNAACVRLDHLFLALPVDASQMTNVLGQNFYLNKTACPVGHPLDGHNVIRKTDNSRQCRQCGNERLRALRVAEPERFFIYDQRKRARIYADPDRHARMLARERRYYALRKKATA